MTEGEELRDPRVKVWPVSRIVVLSLIYIALATGAALVSMEVAMDRVQDMGHYQVEKTREFLGRERANELDEFMHGNANAAEEAASEAPEGEAVEQPNASGEGSTGSSEEQPPVNTEE